MRNKIVLTIEKNKQLLKQKKYSGLFGATWLIMLLLTVSLWQCKKDTDTGVSPTVISTSPTNVATATAVNSKISATFSTSMDSSKITVANFTLQNGTTIVAGAVSATGTVATFIPTVNLTPNTVYTATILAGVPDLAGKTLEKDYVWSFTTGTNSDLLPTVTLTNPLNSATGVSVSQPIAITFSKAMDPTTITSANITLSQGTTSVSGTVTYADLKATFTPASNLTINKVYTVTVTTGVKDVAANALASNYTFSFTSIDVLDVTAPTVSVTDPANNAIGVARNKFLSITFSEAMDPLTISSSTVTLKQGTTAVTGTVAYSGTTATFIPSANLTAGLVYTATVTSGAKDIAGNALTANTVWSFTTGGTTSTLAVVDLGAAANYVILAKTAINNISTSAITGNLGLSPAATSYITGLSLTNATGYATSAQLTGKIYAADMAAPTPTDLTTAVNNMITAYNDAAGRPSPDYSELGTGNIGGKTLLPGLYKWTNTVSMPSDVTISGGANDVWIFQIAGNLTMSSAVKITLIGGAQAKNIFWQVAGQATMGTTTHFEGTILSMTAITFQTGASMNGRALAQTAVILDGNTITRLQ